MVTRVARQRFWMLWQFARRDVMGRYRGASLGLAWTLLQPLAFLCAYAFALIYVMQVKWPGTGPAGGSSPADYVLAIYAGLIVHGLLCECMARAPSLIREQPHLVTKVAFPLHWLPVAALLATLFQSAMNLVVLAAGILFVRGALHWQVLIAPLALFPLIVLTLAVAWFFAALGVYLRDASQAVAPFVALLLFLSPIFWSLDSLPVSMRGVFAFNPLSLPIEWMRATMLGQGSIDWTLWGLYLAVAAALAIAARVFFQRLAPGFADEL